jgi:hypothetical protein
MNYLLKEKLKKELNDIYIDLRPDQISDFFNAFKEITETDSKEFVKIKCNECKNEIDLTIDNIYCEDCYFNNLKKEYESGYTQGYADGFEDAERELQG